VQTSIYTGTTPANTAFQFNSINAPALSVPLGRTRYFRSNLFAGSSLGNVAIGYLINSNTLGSTAYQNASGVITNTDEFASIFGNVGTGTAGSWNLSQDSNGIVLTYSGDTAAASSLAIVVETSDLPFTI